jgi:hypothetical protein
VSYSSIIAAIDAAIEAQAAKPLTINAPDGRAHTYRTLKELTDARQYYARLESKRKNPRGFTMSRIKMGGARG